MTTWISVKDRLPEDDPQYEHDLLLCEPTNYDGIDVSYNYHVGTFHVGGKVEIKEPDSKYWYIDGSRSPWTGKFFDFITHWAKIEPPEETE